MTSFYCTFCGTAINVTDPGAKTAMCSSCKALLPVPANAVGTAGALPSKDDAVPIRRGFPFIQLLFVIPIAIIILCIVPPLWVMKQWSGAVVMLMFGCGMGLFALWRMRQRWTAGRLIWVGCLVAFWGLCSLIVTREHQHINETFGPVQTEFSGYMPPPGHTAPPQPIKLKIFPLFLHSRNYQWVESDAPSLPRISSDMELYRELPSRLKAQTAADVGTIVVLDWGWDATTHAGTCSVTLVDRKTRAVVASKVLTTPNPVAGLATGNARGPQPTNADVLNYLQAVPIAAEQPEPTAP